MKKTTLTMLALLAAVSVFAQGTVNFQNGTAANGVNTRVYGPEVGNTTVSKTGNTAAQTPTGTQTYTGTPLGSGYLAQLWAANGASQAEGTLQGATTISTFRTGSAAGVIGASTVTLTGVPKDAAAATMQVRAWDNSSGLYPTWAQAEVAWLAGTIAAGKSALFNLSAIGGDFNTPPYPVGLQSFNIYTIGAVPEPSTFVLAGLGAAGLLIFRRRK